MLLVWRIRYLDSQDKQFKDRDLWLNTDELDPVDKAAVEMCHDLKDLGHDREMLRYRHLFQEQEYSKDEMSEMFERHDNTSCFSLSDYFEDENGKELTRKQMAGILTGNPDAIMVPGGMKQHDIEFICTPMPSVNLEQIQIPDANLNALAYFTQDFRRLDKSSFLAEGPGTLTGIGWVTVEPILKTAVSDDEIRSFVTVFRRLYMKNEPGSFLKAVEVFAGALLPHPVAKWVQGAGNEYQQNLNSVPDLARNNRATFTRKRLIDVFLNTQYAHQGDERRERQYAECLAEVAGQRTVLFWLFLMSMWECALHIRNAGVQIASFTESYCKCHGRTPSAVKPASEYASMGQLEKRLDRKARIFREKAEELAKALWEKKGRPEGGFAQFLPLAREQLRAAMGESDNRGDSPE